MLTTVPIEELIRRAGTELGASDYVSVDQEMVDEFAERHGRPPVDPLRSRPGGGFALRRHHRPRLPDARAGAGSARSGAAARRLRDGRQLRPRPAAVPRPLPVGERVRMRVALDAADPIPGGCALSLKLTFEPAAGGKPVCVANAIYRIYEGDGY